MSPSTAITIGNFDGVHLGHAALVRSAREAVGASGRVLAIAFDPHPMTVLRPGTVPALLSTFEQRTSWLKAIGADEVQPLIPTDELLGQSPREFVRSMMERFGAQFVVEGEDFRFGHRRAGSVATLRELEGQFGHRTIIVPPVEVALADQSIVRVSSSLIRWLLERGRVRDAALLLGRPFELRGKVVQGDQRGRTIGFPTVNLAHSDLLLPADGIYCGRAYFTRRDHAALSTPNVECSFPAAISVGTKPTFGTHPRTCEAHLIGFEGFADEYGWPIRLQFHDWLRDQLKYPGTEPLIAQLHRDVAATKHRMEPHGLSPAIPCPASA